MTESTLPGHPFIAYHEGELCVEQVRLSALASTYGTPLFVYSKAAMLSALAAYQRGFAGRNAQICYAMKANSTLGILQVFAQAGCGFDIVSGGELTRVLDAGGDPAKVIFSGVGKTRAEMRQALQVGIGCFNVESTPSWMCSMNCRCAWAFEPQSVCGSIPMWTRKPTPTSPPASKATSSA
jgi:diaminopimelate decarboxylase